MLATPHKDSGHGRRLHDAGRNVLCQTSSYPHFGDRTTILASRADSVTPVTSTTHPTQTRKPASSDDEYPFPAFPPLSDPSHPRLSHSTLLSSFSPCSLLSSGHACLQGKRPTMEDEYIIAEAVSVYTGLFHGKDLASNGALPPSMSHATNGCDSSPSSAGASLACVHEICVYAVMDGHGGAQVAQFARKHLVASVIAELQRGYTLGYGRSSAPKGTASDGSGSGAGHAQGGAGGVYWSDTDMPHVSVEAALRHAVLRVDEAFLLQSVADNLTRRAHTGGHPLAAPRSMPSAPSNTGGPARPARGSMIKGTYVPAPGGFMLGQPHLGDARGHALVHGEGAVPAADADSLRAHFLRLLQDADDTSGATMCMFVLHPASGSGWAVNAGDTRCLLLKRYHSPALAQTLKNITASDSSDGSESKGGSSQLNVSNRGVHRSTGTSAISLPGQGVPSVGEALTHALFCANSVGACPLTTDHKATVPSEVARVEQHGGFVTLSRVNGELAVSRALGDLGFKRPCDPDVRQQLCGLGMGGAMGAGRARDVQRLLQLMGNDSMDGKRARSGPNSGAGDAGVAGGRIVFESGYHTDAPVTADPEITALSLASDDVAVVVACDGVWDVLANQMVCDVLTEQLGNAVARKNNFHFAPDYGSAGSRVGSRSFSAGRDSRNMVSYVPPARSRPGSTRPSSVHAETSVGTAGLPFSAVLADTYLRTLRAPSPAQVERCAAAMTDRALQSGSADNISCVVVYLQHLTMFLEYRRRLALAAQVEAHASGASADHGGAAGASAGLPQRRSTSTASVVGSGSGVSSASSGADGAGQVSSGILGRTMSSPPPYPAHHSSHTAQPLPTGAPTSIGSPTAHSGPGMGGVGFGGHGSMARTTHAGMVAGRAFPLSSFAGSRFPGGRPSSGSHVQPHTLNMALLTDAPPRTQAFPHGLPPHPSMGRVPSHPALGRVPPHARMSNTRTPTHAPVPYSPPPPGAQPRTRSRVDMSMTGPLPMPRSPWGESHDIRRPAHRVNEHQEPKTSANNMRVDARADPRVNRQNPNGGMAIGIQNGPVISAPGCKAHR